MPPHNPRDLIEPGARDPENDRPGFESSERPTHIDQGELDLSIAISLKRIADQLGNAA